MMYGQANIKLDFSLIIGNTGSLKFGCYYLWHVPASIPFDDACFEVLETITLYVLYPISDNFEAS